MSLELGALKVACGDSAPAAALVLHRARPRERGAFFRISVKLHVVDGGGPLVFGTIGFAARSMSTFRISVSTAVPRWVIGCVFL